MGQGSSLRYKEKFQVSNKHSYGPRNYKRKNPMSRSQWRRFQRKKKAEKEAHESSNNKPYQNRVSYQTKKPVGRRFFSPKHVMSKGKTNEEENP